MRTPLPDLAKKLRRALGIEDMSPVSLIPALQSDALVREIEQQLGG